MSKKTGHLRRLRSRLFDRGNTNCPICLTAFAEIEVERGRKVTLEHAPPKAMGGQVACLTCSRCNNAGSVLDRAATRERKAIGDYASGRGTEIEVNLFGARRSGLLRPEEGKPLRFPMPTKVGQLRGKMELRFLPGGQGLDVSKGIEIRIKKPSSDHVNASLLRSAYLLVFSLLGSYGYRYAESEAICKVREQIMNPEKKIADCRIGSFSGLEEDLTLISFQFGTKPYFWSVKIGGRGVLLPCGGSIEHLQNLTHVPDNSDMMQGSFGHWVPAQFGNGVAIVSTIRGESDMVDGEFIGTRGENSMDGEPWEWVMVDHQGCQTAALPLGPKHAQSKEPGLGAIMMLGENEVRGRDLDLSKLTRVRSP